MGKTVNERIVECRCGQRMRVPQSALGSSGVCVACGAPLCVTLQNSRPLRSGQPEDPGQASTGAAAQQAGCACCGRAFRGDWDRTPTTEGAFCHRCANRALDPEGQQAEAEIRAPAHNPPPVSNGVADAQPWGMADGFDERMRRHEQAEWQARLAKAKGPLIFAGVSAVVMVLALTLPVEQYVAQLMTREPLESDAELSAAWWLVIAAVDLVLLFVRCFATLYVLLAWVNKLPNETLGKNLIAVGAIALAMTAVGIILPLGGLGKWVVGAIFIYYLYQLEFKHLLAYWLLGLFLDPLFWAIEHFAHGLVAAAAL